MNFECIICKKKIEGAIHVEPEGYYHPECFAGTEKGQRTKFISELTTYAWQVYAENIVSQVLPQVKARFSVDIQKYGLTDDDLKSLIKSRFGLI